MLDDVRQPALNEEFREIAAIVQLDGAALLLFVVAFFRLDVVDLDANDFADHFFAQRFFRFQLQTALLWVVRSATTSATSHALKIRLTLAASHSTA